MSTNEPFAFRQAVAALRNEPIICPGCGETRMIEFDTDYGKYFCHVCSKQWTAPVNAGK